MSTPPIFARSLILCIFLLGSYVVQGQTISTPTVSGTPVCAGSTVDISFRITGSFSANTVYNVFLGTSAGGTASFNVIESFQSNTVPSWWNTSPTITRTITIPAGLAARNDYRIIVCSSIPTSNCSTATQSNAFTINAQPTLSFSGSTNLCGGGTFNLTGTVTGAGNKTVVLRDVNNNFLSSATVASTFNFSRTINSTTTYNFEVTDANGCVLNQQLTITAGPGEAPTVSNNGPICIGGTLQVSASGISGASYAWTGPGGYTSTLQNPIRTNATATMAGTYTVRATVNGCTSNPASTVVVGSLSTGSQTSAGTNSWIGHVYDGTNQGVAFNGNFTNYIGSYTEPLIFDQDFGGDTNCFTVTGNSPVSVYTETFSVRYRMNSNLQGLYAVSLASDDGNRLSIDGALVYNDWSDHSYITTPNILVNLKGNSNLVLDYYENGGGNRLSILNNSVPLIQNILNLNINQTITLGNTGQPISGDTFGTLPTGIIRTGTGYQWYYSTSPGGARNLIVGATGATFTPTTASGVFSTAGTYYLYRNANLTSNNNRLPSAYLASNESNAAILIVQPGISITQQPVNQSVCNGSSTTFTVQATGQNLTYQWQRNTGENTGFFNIDNSSEFNGVTTPSLRVSGEIWLNNFRFRVIISGSNGPSVTSNPAILQVNEAPGYVNQAPNVTVCAGQNASFTTQSSEAVFQWQLSTNSGTSWTDLVNNATYSNVTSGSLIITNATVAMNNYLYRAKVVRNGCEKIAAPSTLTVNANPVITTQPTNQAVSTGTSAVFQAAASGSGLSYRWQAKTTGDWYPIADDIGYSGTSTNSLTVRNVQEWQNNYSFRVVVTNSSGCITASNGAILTVATGPCGIRETIDPASQNNVGTNSWVGHVYEGTNLEAYIGYYTENETFEQSFGSNAGCFPMVAGGSVYTDRFSVRYKMKSSKSGLYVVNLGSDDGSRLRVDGTLIYNNWVDQGFTSRPNVLMMLTGVSQLEFDYYENSGGNTIRFNNLVQVLKNELTGNIDQSFCGQANAAQISGDVFPSSLPTGISNAAYQWTYSTTPGGTRTTIAGATQATYTPNISTAPFNVSGTYYIYRNTTLSSSNNTGMTTFTASHESNPAVLRTNAPITNNGITYGTTGTVCATANEGGTINMSAPTGTVFTSVDFASYGTPAGSCSSFTTSSCHATNSKSIVEGILLGKNSGSIPATNTVFGDPCSGTGKRLYVQATYLQNIPAICSGTNPGTITGTTPEGGSNFSYLWESSITGPATGFTAASGTNNTKDYNPGPLTQTTWLRRSLILPGCATNTSNSVEIRVTPLPTAVVTAPSTVCNNQNVTLTGTFTGVGPWTIQALYNGQPMAPITFQTRDFTQELPVTGTTVIEILSITGGNGCINNNPAIKLTINVATTPTENQIWGEQVSCGSFVADVLTGSDSGNGIRYAWESSITGSTSGFAPAAGTRSNINYNPGLLSQTTWFRRTATSECGSLISNVVEVTIHSPITNNSITLSNQSNTEMALCNASSAGIITGTTPNLDSDNINYLWESSTTSAIAGFSAAPGINNNKDYNPESVSQTTWYRRTVSQANSTCAENISAVVKIIVNPLPTAEVTVTTVICSGQNGTISTILTGTGPWRIAVLMNGTSINFDVPTRNFSQSIPIDQTTSFEVTSIVDLGTTCVNSNPGISFTIEVNNEWVWTGAQDVNWNNPNNWICNNLPTRQTDVLIPQNVTSGNYPVVSTGNNALAKDLFIESGASVKVIGNWLRIAGEVQNFGSFNAVSGSVSFEGGTAQSIPNGTFDDERIENLRIDNTSGVTSTGPVEITGTLKVERGNLYTGNALTLISSAEKTALIDGSGMGEVLGNVTMQRYLDVAFGYKYFSSAFAATTVGDFTDIDLSASFPMFYRYNENRTLNRNEIEHDATGWEAYTISTAPVNPLEGYALNFGVSNDSKLVELTGKVNNGTYTTVLENNNREFTKGFHLIGNPFPSPIDWNSTEGWEKVNLDNGIYFFTAGESQYTGTYTSYVNGISSIDAKSSNIIPSMQGFFIKVSDPADGVSKVTGSLTVNNKSRSIDFDQEFLKTRENEERSLIRLTAGFEKASNKDALVVYFTPQSKTSFDKQLDAYKLMNTDNAVPSFYSISSDKKNLSINALPLPQSSNYEKIPLGIKAAKAGNMTISLSQIQNLPAGMNIYLIDGEKRIGQNLKNKASYSFSIKEGEHHNRFQLIFSEIELSNPAIAFDEKLSVDGTGDYIKVRLNLGEGQKGILHASTVTGQILEIKEGRGKEEVEFRSITSSGIYFINLYVDDQRYSKKVMVNK